MRKPVCLLLIALILFNVLGYYGLFVGLHYRNSLEIIQQADLQNYTDLETVTLKVPMRVPYSTDKEYKRINGEVEFQGEFYRLIKQKISRDTLYVVCVKDINSKRLSHSLTEFVKTFTDKPHAANGKLLKTFTKEYLLSNITLKDQSKGWHTEIIYHFTTINYLHFHASKVIQPPEA